MINLIVQCKQPPQTWVEFCRKPSFSMALDGFVKVGPRFNPNGPHVNFNHHEEVDRLATRATCAQVLMAIRQGLFSTFRDVNGARASVYVNDCDEDVCTSWFLLKNHFLVANAINPRLNRLVDMEDKLDSTAGAYPFPQDLPVLQELAWVFYPYRSFRLGGGLDRKEPVEYIQVIQEVESRIMQHITNGGNSLPVDIRYERMGGGSDWTMVKEIGSHAKTGMFSDGIRAYVAVRERPDGRYTYTVGRMSPFVNFDVMAILTKLNKVEGCTTDCWGGGNTIGGSPRVGGSSLSPQEVTSVVNSVLQERCNL